MTPPYWGGVPCGNWVKEHLKLTALDSSVNLENDKDCRCLGNGVGLTSFYGLAFPLLLLLGESIIFS
jgi:hypothetical protein